MTRLYTSPGAWWRNTISLVVLIAVAIYGVWEVTTAGRIADPSQQQTGYLFGVAFVGGAIYGVWQLFSDARDRIVTLDRDAGGGLIATLWRPWGTLTLAVNAASIANWRFHVFIGNRNARSYFILADRNGYPHPLRFEMRKGVDLEALRQIAPEAVADFESATGRPAAAP